MAPGYAWLLQHLLTLSAEPFQRTDNKVNQALLCRWLQALKRYQCNNVGGTLQHAPILCAISGRGGSAGILSLQGPARGAVRCEISRSRWRPRLTPAVCDGKPLWRPETPSSKKGVRTSPLPIPALKPSPHGGFGLLLSAVLDTQLLQPVNHQTPILITVCIQLSLASMSHLIIDSRSDRNIIFSDRAVVRSYALFPLEIQNWEVCGIFEQVASKVCFNVPLGLKLDHLWMQLVLYAICRQMERLSAIEALLYHSVI